MSSRNPFVTSYIYNADGIKAVEEALQIHCSQVQFIGHRKHAGFFAGRMDRIGGPPEIELAETIRKADKLLKEIEYPVEFDIAVMCDEPYGGHTVIGRKRLLDIGLLWEEGKDES